MSDSTVMISGAGGYLGSIFCEFFSSQGWNVIRASRSNSDDFPFDLGKPEEIAKQKIDKKIDLFIHAAAANEIQCINDPFTSVFVNVLGTKATLDFCVNNHIPRIVYISTFHVFGCPEGTIDERVVPSPSNDYGLSHLQAEEYVEMYARNNKLSSLVVRPSNVFGLPVDIDHFSRWSLTPFAFCREALETKQIRLRTSGRQKRNFVSAYDVCRVIDTLVKETFDFRIIHIAGKDTVSIRELAQMVAKVFYENYKQQITISIPRESSSDQLSVPFLFTSKYSYTVIDSLMSFLESFIEGLKND